MSATRNQALQDQLDAVADIVGAGDSEDDDEPGDEEEDSEEDFEN